jgi:L-ascorbate metabolism protein UlaG (beta-lactamase superfamily)
MHVEWFGQSAFRLREGNTTVFIDPFDAAMFSSRGIRWDYPAITGVDADLLLVTHEHGDHNAVDVIGGDPTVLRSTAGTHESAIGQVVGIASEHDDVAGTHRGHNTIFAFTFGGRRIAHLGDVGQAALRPEQLAALGTIDLLFVPVGGGPTIGAGQATEIAAQLGAQTIVPMHYRTERIDFLEPLDEFTARAARVQRIGAPDFDIDAVKADGPIIVVPAAP